MGTSRRSSRSWASSNKGAAPLAREDVELPGTLGLAQLAVEELLLRQRAQRKTRAHAQFVSMVAHDLRTPLTVIKTCASLMKRQPAKAAELVLEESSRIIHMVDRSSGMIRDMLDFQALRAAGAIQVKRQPMDLVETARAALEELELVHGKRFELTGQAALRGKWDPAGVTRIVENLASNAIKYGSPGKLIRVSVEKKGDWACLSVRNDGAPISRESRSRIFRPFERDDTAGKADGWGLGLALVEAICRAHGGSVAVRSSLRGGTVFTARLKA
jgi:signal transduction histidine kinase